MTTILNFRHLLEAKELPTAIVCEVNALLSEKGLLLRQGTLVGAALIAVPSSMNYANGRLGPEVHHTKKTNQWHFGIKVYFGVDIGCGLVHTLGGTIAHVSDVTQAHALMYGEETDVFADAGYQGVENRPENRHLKVMWNVVMRLGQRRTIEWHATR